MKVFWKVSAAENDMRMRPVLLRNPAGSRHGYASRLANPVVVEGTDAVSLRPSEQDQALEERESAVGVEM